MVEPNNFPDYVANLAPFCGKALVTLRHSLNDFSEPITGRTLELVEVSTANLARRGEKMLEVKLYLL